MMESTTKNHEIRDGFLFLTGLFLFILVILTITRASQNQGMYAFSIRFNKAQSVPSGAMVLVSGVPIGRVTMVSLQPETNKSLVTVKVYESVRLHTDDSYVIATGGLVGDKYINITPTKGSTSLVTPNTIVDGVSTPEMDDLLAAASDLLIKLNGTTDEIHAMIGDKETQQHIKRIIHYIENSTASSAELTEDLSALLKENRSTLTSAISDLHDLTRSSSEMAEGVNRLVRNHKADMDAAFVGLRQTTASSAELVASLNRIVRRNGEVIESIATDLNAVSTDIRKVSASLSPQVSGTQVVKNLDDASKHVVGITERLEHAAATADALLNDKELANALRESADNMRKASADLQAAGANVKEITAGVKTASGDLPGITRPFTEIAPEAAKNVLGITRNLNQTSADIGATTRKLTTIGDFFESFRLEADGRVMALSNGAQSARTDVTVDFRNQSAMLRLGVSDLDNGNRLNAQLGNKVAPDLWLRYGAVQSEFGVGMDYSPRANLRLSGELFAPSDPRANLLADYRLPGLTNPWWLSAGWYDIFSPNDTIGAGVVYRP